MNLLLVDDEVITINTLKIVIPWKEVGIDEIFTASNIIDAKEILLSQSIQIVITDIEMPNGSGLDLISWMQGQTPDIVKILLTCHSKFDYASFALKNGVLDYILKPIDLEEVQNAVRHAVRKVQETFSIRHNIKRQHQSDLLVSEQFWKNFATGLYSSDDYEYIILTARQQAIHFDQNRCFLPILFSIDETEQKNQHKLDATFSFSFKNILNEVILENRADPPAIMLSPSLYLTLPDFSWALSESEITSRSRQVSSFLDTYYTIHADFFIGSRTPVFGIHSSVQKLKKEAEKLKNHSIDLPSSASIVTKIEEIILQNLDKPITCEEIAKQVFLNSEYLSRLFRKKTGKKLSNYIIEVKMEEAKKQLRTTTKAISTISMELGYGNFSHFSKCFRKICGVSPQEYRENS
ncbi:MAG: helix-turn-helix domain-containing protein [Lachnospiraceae bacterium]|nr:helix-turn-helix domain-containing protein [Robinsoniella sp.]MDY3766278.1 helix-turn-helix domain-containing protein [Lachnospiraceae bacterium]